MTDVSRLGPLADAISSSSSRIKAWAMEANRVMIEHETRLRALETPAPTPTPTPVPAPAESVFAFAWGAGRPSLQRCQEMVAAGARWVRFEIEWTNIERTKGVFDWAIYDTAVDAAIASGLKVLAILSTTPAWARPAGSVYWAPPSNPADYAAFCRAAVIRYPRVRHYELWNEPNLSAFWGGRPDPAKYAAMLSAAYPTMKQADPGCTIITGGCAPAGPYGEDLTNQMNGLTFLERVFAAGGRDKFDAVGWHPYDSGGFGYHPSSAWSQLVETPVSVRTLLTSIGRADVPIWATEHGVKVPDWITETIATQRLTDGYSRWNGFTWPKGPLFWFTFRNALTDAPNFSIVDPVTGVQRPRYTAFKAAAG